MLLWLASGLVMLFYAVSVTKGKVSVALAKIIKSSGDSDLDKFTYYLSRV